MATQLQDGMNPNFAFHAMKSSACGMLVTDGSGLVNFVNPAFIKMFNIESTDRLLGLSADEAIETLQLNSTVDMNVRNPDDALNSQECICHCKDGGECTVVVTHSTINDEKGVFAGQMVSFCKTPERLFVKSSLRQNLRRMRLLFDAANVGSWEWDLSSGAITYDVPTAELYGLNPKVTSLNINKIFEVVHPDDLPNLWRSVEEAREISGNFHYEFRVCTFNKQNRWFGVHGQFLCDNHGVPVRVIGVSFDISKRKQTEADLIEKTERLRAIIDTAVEAIISIDRNGMVASFSKAGEKMFGYEPDEVIGKNVKMLMPNPHREQHDAHIKRYLETGGSKILGVGQEVRAQRKDGTIFPIELVVSEIDHLEIFIGLIRDISQRKEVEEQLRRADRLSSIGTLAAGLGHDMNNVLLPVRARLDLVESADMEPKAREQIKEIRKSASYLQDLADGLHLLALDPEDPSASAESTDLQLWWEKTRMLLARALPEHVDFSASDLSGLPTVGIAPHRMTQAVLNLLVNSAKAVGDDGNVRLWAQADHLHGIVRVGIKDNGCGMSDDIRCRALEPFFTTKTRGLGTGLGLTLVHGVVQSANGTMDIISTLGQGTEIILSFPFATNYENGAHRVNEQNQMSAFVSLQDKRIESLVLNLLEIGGIRLDSTSEVCDSDGCLWITDAPDLELDVVRACLNRGCQVIVLGINESLIHEPNITTVENPNDYERLTAAISRVAEGAYS